MRRTTVVLRAVATVLGVVLLLEVLRVWLPSVIFVYGQAGETPATQMGAFALLPFLVAFAGVAAVRFLPPQHVAAVSATVLTGARLGLQATAGGEAQLWVSTVGVTAGLIWLVAVAAGAVAGRTAALGLVGGLTVDAVLHALLRSTDLVWRDGVGPWVVVATVAVAFLIGAWRWAPPTPQAGSPWTGAARGWLVVGPALVLHAIVSGVVSRLHTITEWTEPAAVAVLVLGHGVAVALAVLAVGRGLLRAAARVGAVVALAGLALASGPTGIEPGVAWVAAAGHLLLPVGVAVVVACLVAAPGTVGESRRAAAAAAGMLGFLLLAFGYYAAYDLVLPFPNEGLLWIAALALAAGALTAPQHPVERTPLGVARPVAAGVGVLAGSLLAATALAVPAAPAETTDGQGWPVDVMTYNVQMGFDIHGRHSVDRQAAVIVDDGADIVALQEVSRGWLVNSATDVLPRLAGQVGMEAVFTPAADAVWGNAVLSRYPMRLVDEAFLPQGDVPMRRSVQAVVVELGDGRELGVVNTHLTHAEEDAALRGEQLVVVEEVARRLAAGGRPVVLLGDLNAEPGSDELAALEDWLAHAWDEPPAGTWPSWGPEAHIDHILLSEHLVASHFRVLDVQASDHLPAAATIDVRE